jgi:NDP-sugar pyrophosphorylase family protein
VIRRAMVLAAGRGRRLAPRTDTLPKPLMPIAGRPLLEHILEFLRAGGIEDVVVNLHHLGHLIEHQIGDGARLGVRVRYSWEDPILDTGGGIKRAEPLLAGEPFVVMNGDSLLELPLREMVAFHEARGGVATMAVRADAHARDYGPIELDAHDRVRRIAGRPAGEVAEPVREFMFPGLQILEPQVLDWMEADKAFGIMRVTYPRLIDAGARVFGFVTAARWLNIDTPTAYADSDEMFRSKPFQYS